MFAKKACSSLLLAALESPPFSTLRASSSVEFSAVGQFLAWIFPLSTQFSAVASHSFVHTAVTQAETGGTAPDTASYTSCTHPAHQQSESSGLMSNSIVICHNILLRLSTPKKPFIALHRFVFILLLFYLVHSNL